MAYTPIELEKAQVARDSLKNLIEQRRQLERNWVVNHDVVVQKTELNFKDIKGYNLLDYAIILSDYSAIDEFLAQGVKSGRALSLAIKLANKALVRKLNDDGFVLNYNDISLLYPEGTNLFRRELPYMVDSEESMSILSEVAKEKLQLLCQDSSSTSDQFMHHAAHISISELEDIKIQYSSIDWERFIHKADDSGRTPLFYAIKAGNVEMVNYLISKGCSIRAKIFFPFETPLSLALRAGNLEIVKSLLDAGLSLETVDIDGRNGLHLAVASKNIELVNYLVQTDVDFHITDRNGLTALHYAAEANVPEITALLLSDEKYKSNIGTKDRFGRTPMQIATDKSNSDFIRQATPYSAINPESLIATERLEIRQGYINKKLAYFLTLLNHNPETIGDEGNCDGYQFLCNYYSAMGKRNEFFKILELISAWDGSYESLGISDGLEAIPGNHQNIKELFLQFSNDLIWFQGFRSRWGGLGLALGDLASDKSDKVEIYDFVRSETSSFTLRKHFTAAQRFTEEQLEEYFEILAKHPDAKIQIHVPMHATSLYYLGPNKFAYYDSNQTYSMPAFESAKEAVKFLKAQTWVRLDLGTELNSQGITLTAYQADKFDAEAAKKFQYFTDTELPKTQREIEEFQERSPNRLTQWHYAILADSLSNIKDMLQNSNLDLNVKDVNGKTPLDLALHLDKLDFFEILVNSATISDNYYMDLIYSALSTNNLSAACILLNCDAQSPEEIFDKVLQRFGDKLFEQSQYKLMNMILDHSRSSLENNLEKIVLALSERRSELAHVIVGDGVNFSKADKISYLLNLSKDPKINLTILNQKGLSPLHVLMEEGLLFRASEQSIADVKDLLNRVDINMRTSTNSTFLHYACRSGDLKLVQILLSMNADLDAVNQFNMTPRQVAEYFENSHIVAALDEVASAKAAQSRRPKAVTSGYQSDKHGTAAQTKEAREGRVAKLIQKHEKKIREATPATKSSPKKRQ